MAGYVRQRAAQIVNNSLADADDVKAEFDQLQSAFNSSTGHRHDGTAGEGPPILVTGPNQEYVSSSTDLSPKATATYDLGTTALRYKDAYFSGGVTAAGFTGPLIGAVTGDLTGNVTGNVTGSLTGDVTGNSSTATTLATARNINGTSFNGSANITTSLWGTGRDITIGATGKSVDGSANVSWTLGEIGVNDSTLTLATSGIATGSQTWTSNQGANATFTVNVPATNLSYTAASGDGVVVSSTGTNATLPAATTTNAGLLTATDKTKLDALSTGDVTWDDVTSKPANVTSLAGLTFAENKGLYSTGADTLALFDLTPAGLALMDDADAAAQRVTLGLGSAALLTAGTAANNAVQLDGSARLPAVDGSQLTNLPGVGAGEIIAWGVFNGTITTPTLLAGGNVLSISRVSGAVGRYQVLFNNNPPSANYAVFTNIVFSSGSTGTNGSAVVGDPTWPGGFILPTVSGFKISTGIPSVGGFWDFTRVFFMAVR